MKDMLTVVSAAPVAANIEMAAIRDVVCHAAQIVVNELIFKLLCSYQ